MSTQIENLRALLATGERVLRDRLPIGFGEWDCGTHACLLGWYARDRGQPYGDFYIEDHPEHFGLSLAEWKVLFGWEGADYYPGDAAFESLASRLAYLRALIAARAPKSAIPDSVRAIFTEPQAA